MEIERIVRKENQNFSARLTFIFNRRIGAELKRNCLTQDNKSFTHRTVVNSLSFKNQIVGQDI